jgi:tripartite-type tricarboxylate transporter receptor subunit TctC
VIKRRTVISGAVAAGVSSPWVRAFAQAFPTHPVTMVVPYAAGGNADFTARLLAEAMAKALGQPVIVENKAGGGGAIGATYVIKAKPDGYTIIFCGTGVFSITPQLVDAKYGIADIRPIGFASKTPMVLVAPKSGKYKTLDDLLKGVRSGAKVEIGYGGIGTPNHLALLNFEAIAKSPVVGVPYKGSAPMLQDLLGGQISVGTDQLTTSKPYLEGGQLVALAVFGPPLESMPQIPSLSSIGTEAFDVTTYLGLSAPAGTPDVAMGVLREALKRALDDPRLNAAMAQNGSAVYKADGREFEAFTRREGQFVATMIAQGKIPKQ